MGVNHHVGSGVTSESGATPRLRRGVKALVSGSEGALLVREQHSDGSAFWTLPGGGMRRQETPGEALRRELDEELQCGAVVGPSLDQFVYAHRSRPDTLSVYAVHDCAILGQPRPRADEGIEQCRWVEPGAVPPGTLPQVRAVLRRTARQTGTELENTQ